MDQRHLTYSQTAERLGVKVGTLYAWVARKQIPHVRLGKRVVRFPEDELNAWIDARFVDANGDRDATR